MMRNKYFINILIVIIVLSMVVLPLIAAAVSADTGSMLIFNFLDEAEDDISQKVVYTKDITITGAAPENTEITINIYWDKPTRERSIAYKDKDYSEEAISDEYVLEESITRILGPSGIFAIPARINTGKYKVECIAALGDDIIVREAELEHRDRQKIEEKLRRRFFRNLDIYEE